MFFVSEAVLYLCFALLIGGLLSNIIPLNLQPSVQLPSWLFPTAIIGIAVLSFLPIWRIISYFASDLGFWMTFQSVVFTFEEGKAFLFTVTLSVILIVMITLINSRNHNTMFIISLLLTVLLVAALGWSSHVASKYGWIGFVAHTAHFLAVSIWLGLLLIIGWFAVDHKNWISFLKWYTPLSILCVVVIMVSGWIITRYLVPQYVDAWVLPYGQALLIKHLLFIPLLIFAFLNGFFIKRRLRAIPQYNPLRMVRTESIIALFIFSITGYLGQQAPPHDVTLTLIENKPSTLFLALHPNGWDSNSLLTLGLNNTSVFFALLAGLFLIAGVVFYLKRFHSLFLLLASVFFVITAYLSLMKAV